MGAGQHRLTWDMHTTSTMSSTCKEGLGILPTMAYTIIKALPLKGYLFQASGISKGKDFTSLSIWKGTESCHFHLYKRQGLQILQMHFMCVSGFVIFPCFEDSAFTAVKRGRSERTILGTSKRRSMWGTQFVSRRYMKGVHFLSKWVGPQGGASPYRTL